ncbi:MAG: SGNH/GDSL hydrolase family protein [Mycobacterium sp.]|nr:SGNH/GDSL hydrolase family protein [Mycobacterium sp.]
MRQTLAVAGVLASTGGAVVGARNLLTGQAEQARSVIPRAWGTPPRADGVYAPGGGPVRRWERSLDVGVHLMVFGDSTATGYGCEQADEVPGALLARGLADSSGRPVRLSTKAIVGATSRGLASQVDAMLVAGPPPQAAVIMIGANDVTTLNGIAPSARRLGAAVHRLRACGTAVVVGTCPDFGVITAIPQPLRWTARSLGIRLARAQTAETLAAGGIPVPFADLMAPHFLTHGDRLFSEDRYHPSAAGYVLAAQNLLPALRQALGHAPPEAPPEAPSEAPGAARSESAGRLARLTRLLGRPSTGVSAAGIQRAD